MIKYVLLNSCLDSFNKFAVFFFDSIKKIIEIFLLQL